MVVVLGELPRIANVEGLCSEEVNRFRQVALDTFRIRIVRLHNVDSFSGKLPALARKPRDLRVVRGLGFGLDAKALEAVRQWRFQPALKDGRPVNVQISVEVEFHLY